MSTIIGIVILILDIIAIVDAVKSTKTAGEKTLWVILILILPVLGLILYYLLGRKK
jgi:hypothetical protein